jgi:hypothetical protein
MKNLGLPLTLVALASTLVGCAAPTAPDAAESEPSLAVSWAVEAGEQTHQCARLEVPEGIDIATIDALAPPGTERLTVWYADAAVVASGCPDIDAEGLLFDGRDALELPTGVALRVPAGKDLWLRADVFNDSDTPLTGTSGISLAATDQAHELADVVWLSADMAAGDSCEMPEDTFLFAIAPDVASGAHMLLTAHSSFAGGDVTLFDGGATVGSRSLAQPVALRAGEGVHAACAPTDGVLSNIVGRDEAMACQTAVYRFPAASVGCQ